MQIIKPTYKWAYNLTPRTVTTHLILHHAAVSTASAESIHSYHLSKGWAGIAYHYYVTKDGQIYAGRPENMRGGHTSGWNYCSIGICFEGNFEIEEMPDKQLMAGKELIAEICSRYPSIVVGCHKQFDQTSCPGQNFPFEALLEKKSEPTQSSDEDASKPDVWAKDACDWAIEQGLFVGDGSEDFHWHDCVTRQVLAVIIMRFAETLKR